MYYVWISCIVDDLNVLCIIMMSKFSRGHTDFPRFFFAKKCPNFDQIGPVFGD
jgi:hypothetical protein